MIVRVWDITCANNHVNQVAERHYPATRWDPADGELEREECVECGASLHEGEWVRAEAPYEA